MSEIRSFRRVFALERRIYAIERFRLNPSGVPVRGVAYTALLVLGSLFVQRLPPASLLAPHLPWYLLDLAAPCALGAAFTVLRVDGRAFHLTAASIFNYWIAPRRLVRFDRAPREGRVWRPEEIVIVPDGTQRAPRRLRYVGPGAARIAVSHELLPAESRTALIGRRRSRLVCAIPAAPARTAARIVELDDGSTLEVQPTGLR